MPQLSLCSSIALRPGCFGVGEAGVKVDGNDVLEGSSDDLEGVFPLALRLGGVGGSLCVRLSEHLEGTTTETGRLRDVYIRETQTKEGECIYIYKNIYQGIYINLVYTKYTRYVIQKDISVQLQWGGIGSDRAGGREGGRT